MSAKVSGSTASQLQSGCATLHPPVKLSKHHHNYRFSTSPNIATRKIHTFLPQEKGPPRPKEPLILLLLLFSSFRSFLRFKPKLKIHDWHLEDLLRSFGSTVKDLSGLFAHLRKQNILPKRPSTCGLFLCCVTERLRPTRSALVSCQSTCLSPPAFESSKVGRGSSQSWSSALLWCLLFVVFQRESEKVVFFREGTCLMVE